MLSFFRTNQLFLNVLLLFYLVFMRASTFIHPLSVTPREHGILTSWVYSVFPPLSISAGILSLVLVFFQATIINLTIARYRVATDVSLLPGLFYCLVTSLIPDFLPLSSVLLANTFLILGIYSIFDIYKKSSVAGKIFDTGLWIGTASLFHFSYIFLILWGIVGIGILRGIRLREFAMLFIGIIVPQFLMGVYCFWIDALPSFGRHFIQNIGRFHVIPYSSTNVYVKLGVMSVLLFYIIFSSSQFFSRRNITSQKYISMMYWLLLISGLSVFTQSNIELNQLLILSVPLGILLSMAIQRIRPAMADALHMIMIMAGLILQYLYLLG